MDGLPRTLAPGVYVLVIDDTPGANKFSMVKADLESTSTVDTYTVSVGFNKVNRTTFIHQLEPRNTVTASTSTEDITPSVEDTGPVPDVPDTIKDIKPTHNVQQMQRVTSQAV